ncbi:MAG: NfeD family protein [Actinomycetota bacterium]
MSILLAAAVTTGLLSIWLIIVIVRALRASPLSGREGMIGSPAVTSTAIDPEGWVIRKGILWHARCAGPAIREGLEVKVREVSGLWLIVEAAEAAEVEEDASVGDRALWPRRQLAQLVPLGSSDVG